MSEQEHIIKDVNVDAWKFARIARMTTPRRKGMHSPPTFTEGCVHITPPLAGEKGIRLWACTRHSLVSFLDVEGQGHGSFYPIQEFKKFSELHQWESDKRRLPLIIRKSNTESSIIAKIDTDQFVHFNGNPPSGYHVLQLPQRTEFDTVPKFSDSIPEFAMPYVSSPARLLNNKREIFEAFNIDILHKMAMGIKDLSFVLAQEKKGEAIFVKFHSRQTSAMNSAFGVLMGVEIFFR